jgi:hypothetical protein
VHFCAAPVARNIVSNHVQRPLWLPALHVSVFSPWSEFSFRPPNGIRRLKLRRPLRA